MPNIGTVTIVSPQIEYHTYRGGDIASIIYIDWDDMRSIALPPEQTAITSLDTKSIPTKESYQDHTRAWGKYYSENGVIASLTGKSKELTKTFQDAHKAYENNRTEYALSMLIFASEKFIIPLPFTALVNAFNEARAGQNMTLTLQQGAPGICLIERQALTRPRKASPPQKKKPYSFS